MYRRNGRKKEKERIEKDSKKKLTQKIRTTIIVLRLDNYYVIKFYKKIL